MGVAGEIGCPMSLSAPCWGFQDVVLRGQPLRMARPLASYVMEHILFKVAYPAEFHAQTAVEAAIKLHPRLVHRLTEIESIRIETQEAALRIIDKTGPLSNPADRDHCLQYMVAVGLIFGDLTADHYLDGPAADPRIDALRARMVVTENQAYSRDYLDPDKRAIANALQIQFQDGSKTPRVAVEYPIGHPRRRREALSLLDAKFRRNLHTVFTRDRLEAIQEVLQDREHAEAMPVDKFMDLLQVPVGPTEAAFRGDRPLSLPGSEQH